MDVVPDERGIPKVVVYVGDKDQRPSDGKVFIISIHQYC